MWKERLKENTSIRKGWTPTHSFFAVMGGFWDPSTEQVVNARVITSSESKNLLHEYNLVIRGSDSTPAVVVIGKGEIFDRSKGDGLGKLILIVHTLWFVTQYLGRWIDHLPRTQLEVMTLAYAALTIAVYCLWWHKPLNVHFPITISPSTQPTSSFNHYPGVGLFRYGQLPEPKGRVRSGVIMTVALAAVVFGGIHCLAWNFTFPTSQQKLLWRICAAFIAADPILLAAILNWGTDLVDIPSLRMAWELGIVGVVYAFFLTFHLISRGILFVITLLALRSSPPGIYQTIPWASFIPHIG